MKFALSIVLIALFASSCVEPEVSEDLAGDDEEETPRIRAELADAGDARIVGTAPPPRAETGHAPRYELHLEQRGDAPRELGIEAIDAAYDPQTQTLAWIDPLGTLYAAPLASAPRDKEEIAREVIPGLAAEFGKLAFAVRVNGPETSPLVYELGSGELLPLDDGEGPDEVIGFSPDGESVLLMSGRTGIASLFDAGIRGTQAVQLTNVGLAPGPNLDPEAVVPSPMSLREVSWEASGIAYQAADSAVFIEPDGEVHILDRDAPIEGVSR